jgi:hypothetical protein
MSSTFLEVDGIRNEAEAVVWSINAAVQRNRVYQSYDRRDEFRADWMRMLRAEAQRYRLPDPPMSDSQHYRIIPSISDRLSAAFGASLIGGRLRFGTSQKALNLYLKYLWQLGDIGAPPHCPVDRIVLDALDIDEAWTKCDDENRYMTWIGAIRRKAGTLSVAEWENDVWLRAVAG